MTANGKEPRSGETREGARRDADPPPSFVAELWHFLRENKKWWLLPMVAALLLVGALIVFGGTSTTPFVYRLF
jgi:hypothetical protein